MQKDNRLDETQKQWSRNQDTKEIVKKPRPRSQGQEEMGEKKMDDKQKPIKHNKKNCIAMRKTKHYLIMALTAAMTLAGAAKA